MQLETQKIRNTLTYWNGLARTSTPRTSMRAFATTISCDINYGLETEFYRGRNL